jgi:CheY-like chemotaxis protein
MGQPADLARTREAGFDQHLTKPASPGDLFRAVATSGYVAATNVVAFRAGGAAD